MIGQVIDVTRWAPLDREQLGKKDKLWVVDNDDSRWLFKEARSKQGRVRGEDWAEVLVAFVCGQLGIAVSDTYLARR